MMIKVLLVERNVILRNHLLDVLSHDEYLDIIEWCTEGCEVIRFLKENEVDIILMDHLQTNGLVITAQIKRDYPSVKIIGFSTDDINDSSNRLIELGATSYLSKYDTSLEDLIAEIKSLTNSNYVF